MAKGGAVRAGDPAPDFTLEAADGSTVSLRDFRGRSEVVLFFYPKDGSPACTAEACSFRDSHEAFRDAGATVIGVSNDGTGSHRSFADRHHLPYLLLSDPGGKVRGSFGVPRTFGFIPGRVTYLIDREGIVRLVFSSQFRPDRHVAEALKVLEAIRDRLAGGTDPPDGAS